MTTTAKDSVCVTVVYQNASGLKFMNLWQRKGNGRASARLRALR